MIDIVAARWAIFERTRRHTYLCLAYGFRGLWEDEFKHCRCDSGNKMQYLQDLVVQRVEKEYER